MMPVTTKPNERKIMSYHHNLLVAKIRRKGGWIVQSSPAEIVLTKNFNRKPVSIVLYKNKDKDTYILRPAVYEFHSTVSHFDYIGDIENRWTRNKQIFYAVVKLLKDVKAWKSISNPDFLKVNTFNKKSKKYDLQENLRELIKGK